MLKSNSIKINSKFIENLCYLKEHQTSVTSDAKNIEFDLCRTLSTIAGTLLCYFCDCLLTKNNSELEALCKSFVPSSINKSHDVSSSSLSSDIASENVHSKHLVTTEEQFISVSQSETTEDFDNEDDDFVFESCNVISEEISGQIEEIDANYSLIERCATFLSLISYDLLKDSDLIWSDPFLITKVYLFIII